MVSTASQAVMRRLGRQLVCTLRTTLVKRTGAVVPQSFGCDEAEV